MTATRVVNVSWETFDVYIGRGSEFGNPFTHRHIMHPDIIAVVPTVEEAIRRYREWLWQRLQFDGGDFLHRVASLHGRTLGCHCKPKPCHGDVLAKAAEWAHGEVRRIELIRADR